ncbi:MAG: response regulator, partial [Thermoanaerobaculia bacterium]
AAGITDGFLLDRAETLEQALDYLRRFEYDAAFVDLTLPDSAGVAAVESILCRAPGLPVIALSRLHDDELALRCIRAGAEDHVYKDPESVEGLLRALGFAMERSRARVGAGHTPASAGEHGEPRPTTRRTVAPALPRPLGQE